MKTTTDQSGFTALEAVLLTIIVAIVGATGWYVLHSKQNANQTLGETASSTAVTTPYYSWKTYTNPAKTYSVQYPATWGTFNNGEVPTLATDVEGIGPKGNAGLITISSYKSSDTPRAFLTADQQTAPAKSEDLSINGSPAYYQLAGDGTNSILQYAIAKKGVVVTVSMTVKSNTPTLTAVDNTTYINQFNLVAKSVKLL